MKIKLLVGMAGNRFSYKPGDVIDIDDDTAIAYINTKQAEYVVEPEPVVREVEVIKEVEVVKEVQVPMSIPEIKQRILDNPFTFKGAIEQAVESMGCRIVKKRQGRKTKDRMEI